MSSFAEYHMVFEARKNPEQNPKVPAIKIIQQWADEADNPWSNYTDDVNNCFVSFTALNKLGINPTSNYDTPNMLYAYTGKSFEDKSVSSDVPFAGKQPFINIFKAKNPKKVVILNMMGRQQYHGLVDKIRDYYVKFKIDHGINKFRNGRPLEQKDQEYLWKQFSDEFEKILNDAPDKAYINSIGGQFWYITMRVAQKLSDMKEYSNSGNRTPNAKGHYTTIGAPNSWNLLFRGIGIDGCIDTGEGIIHSAEKQQCCFVGSDVIELIQRIDNKEYEKRPLPREHRTKVGGYIVKAAEENNPQKIADMVTKLAVVKDDPYTTRNIIQGLNLSALTQLCRKIEPITDHILVDSDNKIKELREITEHILTLIVSTKRYNPSILGKDGQEDLYYDVSDGVRQKLSNILVNWPLLYIVAKVYGKEEIRRYLVNIAKFYDEFSDKPIDYLVEVIHFFHDMNMPWWEDSFFDGVVNSWDKLYPTSDEQVGVWNKAESWGYVK